MKKNIFFWITWFERLELSIFVIGLVEAGTMEAFSTEQPAANSGSRMPQSPRRQPHQVPPSLKIQPASSSELGPPAQVQVRWAVWKKQDFHDNSLSSFVFAFVFLIFVRHLQGFPSWRVPQLTPGASGSAVGSKSLPILLLWKVPIWTFLNSVFQPPLLQPHFFDEDDRMVPSTPTLVVPHRSDGLDQAIQ